MDSSMSKLAPVTRTGEGRLAGDMDVLDPPGRVGARGGVAIFGDFGAPLTAAPAAACNPPDPAEDLLLPSPSPADWESERTSSEMEPEMEKEAPLKPALPLLSFSNSAAAAAATGERGREGGADVADFPPSLSKLRLGSAPGPLEGSIAADFCLLTVADLTLNCTLTCESSNLLPSLTPLGSSMSSLIPVLSRLELAPAAASSTPPLDASDTDGTSSAKSAE